MKKITGKTLSLVLSLALVASSFPAIFASASTRTADGIVSGTDQDSIYLVNGGTGYCAKSPELIGSWIKPELETKTRDQVDSVRVDAISHVSGDSLVTLTTSDSNQSAWLKLKSQSVKGSEVISVLYEGTYTDGNGNDYTIKARKNFTVIVYDKGTPVLGEVKDSNNPQSLPDRGKGLDNLETFAQTRNTVKTAGLYLAEPYYADPNDANSNAEVFFAPIYVTTNKNGFKSADVGGSATDNLTGAQLKDSAYYFEISDGKSDLHFNNSAMTTDRDTNSNSTQLFKLNGDAQHPFQLVSGSGTYSGGTYSKDASTMNVTFTLKKLTTAGTVSTSSSDKYTFKTKIEKKINIDQAFKNYNASLTTPQSEPTSWTVKKDNGQTRLSGVRDPGTSDDKGNKDLNVSDAVLDFPKTTTSVSIGDDQNSTNTSGIVGYVGALTIGQDARVGYINIKDGTVDNNGKIGNITTDDKLYKNDPDNIASPTQTNDGSVTIEGSATAGMIDTTAADNDTTNEGTVTINGGTTGDVTTKSTVSIDAVSSDNNISTGVVTAVGGTIYSDAAKVSLGGLKAKDNNGTFTFEGDNITVKSLDMDSRTTTLQLGNADQTDEAFTGAIPFVQNAVNTTLKAENDNTKATVNGDINANEISLDSNTQLTMVGNTQVKTIDGDGTLVIPAGKLYVTDSVSGTRLKLSDANLAAGMTVFKANADTVSESDFNCYGFTLSKTSGNTVDTFMIASLNFAGVAISGGPSQIAVGQSATYTASAYPSGTSLPSGYTVEWTLDGGSSDVFTMTSSGSTATVKVSSLDATFASENKTTLTATLYDADGYQDDNYTPATFDVTATDSAQYTPDTTGTVMVAQGATYQFKITSSDGSQPTFTVGGSAFNVTPIGKSGNAYFYKITAAGKVGSSVGVYVGGTRIAVATITAPSYTVDTGAALSIKAGTTYTFRITSFTKPTFASGNSSVLSLVKSTVSGINYFYTVKAIGKVGQSTGVYVNGVRCTIATIK